MQASKALKFLKKPITYSPYVIAKRLLRLTENAFSQEIILEQTYGLLKANILKPIKCIYEINDTSGYANRIISYFNDQPRFLSN